MKWMLFLVVAACGQPTPLGPKNDPGPWPYDAWKQDAEARKLAPLTVAIAEVDAEEVSKDTYLTIHADVVDALGEPVAVPAEGVVVRLGDMWWPGRAVVAPRDPDSVSEFPIESLGDDGQVTHVVDRTLTRIKEKIDTRRRRVVMLVTDGRDRLPDAALDRAFQALVETALTPEIDAELWIIGVEPSAAIEPRLTRLALGTRGRYRRVAAGDVARAKADFERLVAAQVQIRFWPSDIVDPEVPLSFELGVRAADGRVGSDVLHAVKVPSMVICNY